MANLTLPISRSLDSRPDSDRLPLPLQRPLGSVGELPDISLPRRMTHIAGCTTPCRQVPYSIAGGQHHSRQGQSVTDNQTHHSEQGQLIKISQSVRIVDFAQLTNAWIASIGGIDTWHTSQTITYLPFLLQEHQQYLVISGITHHANTNYLTTDGHNQQNSQYVHISPVTTKTSVAYYQQQGRLIADTKSAKISQAHPVPCRYYPIPEITPPPITPVCRLRPPAGRLPLTLTRRRSIHPSHALPLPLLCWHDAIPKIIPNHRSYIVHNVVTAHIAGIAINPIAFSIKTDMHSYCWQGSIDITASDYANIKTKLDTQRGKEPLITVNINGFIFAIIAEEHSRRRQFVSHSHTLSGRSITARLGADYAQAQGLLGNHTGLIDQDSYSSQIVQQQLNGLGVQIDRWEAADWLIPANVYSITGKTPIAVIADIATAAGGFISSHPHDAKLSLKPRWTKPAWELATATPAVTLPADVIRQIDDSKRVNPRYNTITLTSTTQGGIVYRNGQGRDKDAPTVDNILYTDRDVIVPAGIALLSDSGRHTEYTLTLRWMNKYNLPLAELGQIWQVNDPEGAWRGVVTAVNVQVKLEDDVPTIWQTVSLDRYLDA